MVMRGALPDCSHCNPHALLTRHSVQSLVFRPAARQQIASRHSLVVQCQRPQPSNPNRGGGGGRGRGGGNRGGRGGRSDGGGRGYQGTAPQGNGGAQPGGAYRGRNPQITNPQPGRGYQGSSFRGGMRGGRSGQMPQMRNPLDGKTDEQIEEQARADLAARAERQKRNRPESDVPVNEQIEADEVRVVNEQKEMLGVMSLLEALDMADELDVDVVMINPQADPPVVRLVDYSKFRYEQTRAKKEANKKQREARQDLKELKFRPSTDVHDYQVRLRSAQKFISKGDKVKLTITFKGREMQFQDIGRDLFKKFVEDLQTALEEEAKTAGKKDALQATVQQDAKMQGNQMTLLLSPNVNK